MYARGFVAIVAFALVLNVGLTGTPKADDTKNIQGTWKLVSVDGGEKPPPEAFKKLRISITADQLIVKEEGKQINSSSYKLNPSKKPKEIDFVVMVYIDQKTVIVGEKLTRLGIYELMGDDLKICAAWATSKRVPDPATRPKEFKASGDLVVMNLKREK